jgi:hypothetical protein
VPTLSKLLKLIIACIITLNRFVLSLRRSARFAIRLPVTASSLTFESKGSEAMNSRNPEISAQPSAPVSARRVEVLISLITRLPLSKGTGDEVTVTQKTRRQTRRNPNEARRTRWKHAKKFKYFFLDPRNPCNPWLKTWTGKVAANRAQYVSDWIGIAIKSLQTGLPVIATPFLIR